MPLEQRPPLAEEIEPIMLFGHSNGFVHRDPEKRPKACESISSTSVRVVLIWTSWCLVMMMSHLDRLCTMTGFFSSASERLKIHPCQAIGDVRAHIR